MSTFSLTVDAEGAWSLTLPEHVDYLDDDTLATVAQLVEHARTLAADPSCT